MDDAEFGGALDQVGLSLEDRGIGLIEIRGHPAQVFVAIGLRWQA
jgi:hypothetical protein